MDLLALIKDSIKAVPAVRYALGIAGVAATVAVIAGFTTSPQVAVFGSIIMFGLMFILVLFSRFTKVVGPSYSWLVLSLAWAFVILTICTSFFIFTGYFFSWPRRLDSYIQSVQPDPNGGQQDEPPSNGNTQLEKQDLVVNVGKTETVFGGDLIITVRHIYENGDINATIGSVGYPNQDIRIKGMGYATKYEGLNLFDIRIIETNSAVNPKFAKFRITRIKKLVNR